MNLADKLINAQFHLSEKSGSYSGSTNGGLTYREWLIGMLASNKEMVAGDVFNSTIVKVNYEKTAKTIIKQADVIIKQLEAEK
jgi:hypothetical protein